jgi:hypothetical protein
VLKCCRGVGGIEMDGLHVHGEQRHPDVVYICDRPSGSVLECVADFEILVVKTGCFPVPRWAQLPVCRKRLFRHVSLNLFHSLLFIRHSAPPSSESPDSQQR